VTRDELDDHLSFLKVSPPEAAQLLGISPRTLRRYFEGEDVPGPIEAALRAWRSLQERHLPWKPDTVSIVVNDQDQIERHLKHAEEFAALLKRVEARGGPKNPWTVDFLKCAASFGPLEVGFYKLQNEGFSLSTFRRRDRAPDLARDMPDIEDAAYCIADTFAKARASSAALKAVAAFARKNSSAFVVDGAKPLDQPEKARRRRLIESLADKIDQLAAAAAVGRGKYEEFESSLQELHALGFFPTMSLISAVAHAMV
jgi:hypothetical protein